MNKERENKHNKYNISNRIYYNISKEKRRGKSFYKTRIKKGEVKTMPKIIRYTLLILYSSLKLARWSLLTVFLLIINSFYFMIYSCYKTIYFDE